VNVFRHSLRQAFREVIEVKETVNMEEVQAHVQRFAIKGGFVIVGVKEFDTLVSELFVANTIIKEVAEQLQQHSIRIDAVQTTTPSDELVRKLLEKKE
jgi:hypothetical protein